MIDEILGNRGTAVNGKSSLEHFWGAWGLKSGDATTYWCLGIINLTPDIYGTPLKKEIVKKKLVRLGYVPESAYH